MTVQYTINHAISDELETWLAGQPDFISIDIQHNVTHVYYDHASEAEELAFKDLLAKQIGLSGENINTSDTNLVTNISITPPALTVDVDDYNPTGLAGAGVIRIDGGAGGRNISGLAGGYAGRIIILVNAHASNEFTITNEDTNSTAANRFVFDSVSNILVVQTGQATTLMYSGDISRWIMISNAIPDESIRTQHIVDGNVWGSKLGSDANGNWNTGTTTGVKIGTATTQKLGFYNAAPVVQPAANADTSGATLGQLETEVNELKALLRSLGLMAT